MSRLVWIVLAIVLSSSIYFTIRYGLRPKPIPILNPTEFSNPEQIGAVAYRALREVVANEKLIVLGSTADFGPSIDVWNGFLKTAVTDGVNLSKFFEGPGLPRLVSVGSAESVALAAEEMVPALLLKQISEVAQKGQAVVVHVSASEASHLVPKSLTRQIEQLPNTPVLALSVVPWSFQPEEVERLAEQCAKGAAEKQDDQRIICARYKLARKFRKKKLDPSKMWAAMERHGLKEYLIFIRQSE